MFYTKINVYHAHKTNHVRKYHISSCDEILSILKRKQKCENENKSELKKRKDWSDAWTVYNDDEEKQIYRCHDISKYLHTSISWICHKHTDCFCSLACQWSPNVLLNNQKTDFNHFFVIFVYFTSSSGWHINT